MVGASDDHLQTSMIKESLHFFVALNEAEWCAYQTGLEPAVYIRHIGYVLPL